jgi:hypothetical protein
MFCTSRLGLAVTKMWRLTILRPLGPARPPVLPLPIFPNRTLDRNQGFSEPAPPVHAYFRRVLLATMLVLVFALSSMLADVLRITG